MLVSVIGGGGSRVWVEGLWWCRSWGGGGGGEELVVCK